MTNRNRLFAGFGVLFAYAVFMLLTPKQMLVLGPERSIRLAPVGTAVQSKLPLRAPATASAAKPRDVAASPDPWTPVVTQAPEAGEPRPSQYATTMPDEAVRPSSSTAAGVLDFGAEAMGASAEAPLDGAQSPKRDVTSVPALPAGSSSEKQAVAAVDPWSPVVTAAAPDVSLGQPVLPTPAPATVPSVAIADRPTVSAMPQTAWTSDGISDAHASVAPLLAAHPDRDLILCLAGCGGRASIVAIRLRPSLVEADGGEMVPTASAEASALPRAGDIVCVAGCVGKPGEVVFRNVRLSWISDEGSNLIRTALRVIADRLIAAEGLDADTLPPSMMTETARLHLVGPSAGTLSRFGFTGPRVGAWVRRLPVIAEARGNR
ncbi:MAG: hypothetical protein ACT4N2_00760 [Hyphomicrobium sp.]